MPTSNSEESDLSETEDTKTEEEIPKKGPSFFKAARMKEMLKNKTKSGPGKKERKKKRQKYNREG